MTRARPTVKWRVLTLTVVATGLWLAAADTAWAQPPFELAGGVHGRGGFNARATGPGSASTYFNPALLPKAEPGVDVAVMVVYDDIDIELDPRPDSLPCNVGGMMQQCSIDVPDDIDRAVLPPDNDPLPTVSVPTSWLEEGHEDFEARPRQTTGRKDHTTYYAVVGLTVPVFDEYLVFGFYGMVPIGDFTRASSFHVDEREQLFTNSLYAERYEDRLEATSLALALASQVHEKLSIGVATTLNLTNRAQAPVFVPDAGNLADIRLLSDVRVDVGVAPHLGVSFEPTDDLDFSFTTHSPTRFEIIADYEFTLRDGSVDSSSAKFTHSYTPWKVALGGAWDVYERPEHDVQVAATLEYTLWSSYIDRVSNRPLPEYSWNDTASGAVGVRWRYGKLHTYADVLYEPSPVPQQKGRTNYVDNDRVGALLGAEGEFELFGTDFRAGAQLQLHRLLPRSTRKDIPPQDGSADHLVRDALPDDAIDGTTRTPIEGREGLQTNNPGFPGFDSDGWLVGAMANLSVLF